MDIPARFLKPDLQLWLCPDAVRDVAEVFVNGVSAGVLWTAPWRAEISSLLRQGRNTLEIRVANRWINRLIGDEQYPPEYESRIDPDGGYIRITGEPLLSDSLSARRHARPMWRHYTAADPLEDSGLIGEILLVPVYNQLIR